VDQDPEQKVAIIGAGISGLVCARTLADCGICVTVFEKARGVGGRMATRRTETNFHFDHGAQYFTVRDPCFKRYVESWSQDRIVAPWLGRIVVLEDGSIKEEKQGTNRYVAVPSMNAICRHLATGLDVRCQSHVTPPKRSEHQWELTNSEGNELGKFNAVVVSAPAGQTADLLNGVPHLANQVRQVKMSGCWAVMIALAQAADVSFDAAFVHNSSLSWISRNSSKPGRNNHPETWVLHASAEWSEANREALREEVAAHLVTQFWKAIGIPAQAVSFSIAHQWRFALPLSPLEDDCLFVGKLQIAACGDWCAGPRVEGAFLSGMAAAERLLASLAGSQSK
jgi:predicted NAD/FAD-dependent oxidoreductase